MAKHKILFCSLDIGGRIELYSSYIKKMYPHVIVESFVKFKVKKEHYQTDYNYHFNYQNRRPLVQYLISFFFLLFALSKYSTFYIISGENIMTRRLLHLELFLYKLFGKKLIMHFVGSDIRNPDYLRWKNKQLMGSQEKAPAMQKPFQKKLCRLAEKYASRIIVSTPDLKAFFEKEVDYIPVFIDENKFKKELEAAESSNESKKIKILHAPSNPEIKGTDYITSVLEKIEKEEDVELVITTSERYRENIQPPYLVTKYKLMSLYKEADIVIDQALIGWYGMQCVEALIANNIAICYIDPELKPYLQENAPICNFAKPTEMESAIKEAIDRVRTNTKPEYWDWIKQNHKIEYNSSINNVFNELFNIAS